METDQRFKIFWAWKSLTYESAFISWLVKTGLITRQEAREAEYQFRLGGTKDGSSIFWQVDASGRVYDGKVVPFDKRNRRLKYECADSFGHVLLRKKAVTREWSASQCLFGLNQLTDLAVGDDAVICIVESEQTAIFLSQKIKDCVWMASGGKNALNLEVLKALVGYRVRLFPSTDPYGETYRLWYKLAWEAKRKLGLKISICDILEKQATAEQKKRRIDPMDFALDDDEFKQLLSSESQDAAEASKGSAKSSHACDKRIPMSQIALDIKPSEMRDTGLLGLLQQAASSVFALSTEAFGPVRVRGDPLRWLRRAQI